MKRIEQICLTIISSIAILILAACGKNDLISTKEYDFYTKLREVESVTESLNKKLTEDMYLNQTEMNELSGEICSEWQAFLDEVITVLDENLSKKEFKAFEEEQATWLSETETEVNAYASGFGDGSMATLLYNMEMGEKLKYRAYELMKYFENP